MEKNRFTKFELATPVYKDQEDMEEILLSPEELQAFEGLLKRQKVEVKDKYEGVEHEAIGLEAMKMFLSQADQNQKINVSTVMKLLEDNGLLKARNWVLGDSLCLSSGNIISLAGDFYGIPEQPISFGECAEERKKRFKQSYYTLFADSNNPQKVKEVEQILEQMRNEHGAVKDAIRDNKRPSVGLHAVSSKGNVNYGNVTRYTFFPFSFLHSRYISLATNNFDHFGKYAKLAYSAGHELAIEAAKKARMLPAQLSKKKAKLLFKAFTMELFACHFLTDLFSSGHIRTPRKAIYDYVMKNSYTSGKAAIAGLLAKEMHDEDNKEGLNVYSYKKIDGWRAYGDACYFDPENNENHVQVCLTVVAALNSIVNQYMGLQDDYNFKDYIPRVQDDNANKPLFVSDKLGNVNARNPADKSSAEVMVNWSPIWMLTRLKMKHMKEGVVSMLTGDEGAESITEEQASRLERELSELYDTNKEVVLTVGDNLEDDFKVGCTIF